MGFGFAPEHFSARFAGSFVFLATPHEAPGTGQRARRAEPCSNVAASGRLVRSAACRTSDRAPFGLPGRDLPKMWIVDLRRDRRAAKRSTQRWVSIATAARQTAAGRAAVMLGDAASEPAASTAEARPPQPTHLFMLSRATLISEGSSGRRRLHHFDAAGDVSLEPDQRPMAELLLRLGCACQALPPPGKRDTLVRLQRPTDVAGLHLESGAAAALDFDPLAVLPQLRGLGLYPWEVLPIEKLGEDGCHGSALDDIRLVLRLDRPWQPLRSSGFLAGVFVDTTYRDYRRQPPSGQVLRAYFTHGDRRPPRAVLARPDS